MADGKPSGSSDRATATTLGAAVGAVAALAVIALDAVARGQGVSLGSALTAHTQNPALWLTDLMPIYLGALAWALTAPPAEAPPPPPKALPRPTHQDTAAHETRIAALEKARDKAIAASRSKSLFLANMSHELRTPLNAIIGYSEMMREDIEDGEPADAEDLVRVSTAARHLLELINNILDLSKIEVGKMSIVLEPTSLASLVHEVETTVGPLARKKQNTFEIQIDPEIQRVRADHMRLRQVLINLLGNAFKFTEQGTIRLVIHLEEGPDLDWVRFDVVDSGIGMTPEQLGRLFQEYSQADATIKSKFGGTGLGLAISQRLAELMGGRIDVTSEMGVGSTFTLRLPMPDLLTDGTPAESEPAEACVLVIDDDPVIVTAQRHLKREGFEVLTATNAADGLQMAQERQVHAILLDVQLQEGAGWQVLETLTSSPPTQDIPVVIASVDDDADRAHALGAVAFLPKPLSNEEVVSTVRRYRAE